MPSKLSLIDVCFREDATAGPTTEMRALSGNDLRRELLAATEGPNADWPLLASEKR